MRKGQHGYEILAPNRRRVSLAVSAEGTSRPVAGADELHPATSRITVGEWSQRWLDGQAHLKPSTRERYAGILRAHVVPKWGHTRLSDVSHADVQAWVSTLARTGAPATVRKAHRVLSLVLAMAVADGRLARNPASHVRLPRAVAGDRRYLTHEQVHALADACGPHYRLIVLFLAYTGTRFGEMAALRASRLDLPRHRALIAESVTLVNGDLAWGTPKGHERREVPVPRFLSDQLREHVAGLDPEVLVFTGPRGAVLRAQTMQRASFARAAAAIGVPGLHLHELRHTAASLAIASRADVKVVQQMLGHKSATMTLDLYRTCSGTASTKSPRPSIGQHGRLFRMCTQCVPAPRRVPRSRPPKTARPLPEQGSCRL